jgi:hypothetical protein
MAARRGCTPWGEATGTFANYKLKPPNGKSPRLKVDHGAKTVVVKTADGTEKTLDFTENAGKDMGKAVGAGTEKGAKVAAYYTDEAGKKVAHFFGL